MDGVRFRGKQPIGYAADLAFAVNEGFPERWRKIPLRDHVGQIRDFFFEFGLPLTHRTHLIAHRFECLPQFLLELLHHVIDNLFPHDFFLEAGQKDRFQLIAADSRTVLANRLAPVPVHRTAVSLACFVPPLPPKDCHAGATFGTLQKPAEKIRGVREPRIQKAVAPIRGHVNTVDHLTPRFRPHP